MDKPGKVANLARGQLNRDFLFSLSPFAPEKLVSRDGFGRPVPRQPTHSPHSRLNLIGWCLLSGFLPLSATMSIYLSPSGQSRVHQVTRLRIDGVHCQESSGTGPVVVLKVVPVTGAAFSSTPMDHFFVRLSFPTPTSYRYSGQMRCVHTKFWRRQRNRLTGPKHL